MNFVLSNLREWFFWASGLGNFLLFVFVAKFFVQLFRRDK